MIKRIKKYAFSNDVPLEERRFTLTGIMVCLAIIAVLVSVITSNQSLVLGVGLAITFIVILGVIRYTLHSKRYKVGAIIMICIANLIVIPIGYHLGGGLNSGAPIWLVNGMLIVFVLLRGKTLMAFLAMTVTSFAITMYIGEIHPEYTQHLQAGYSQALDAYISMLSVSIICGILFMFQSGVLEGELDKAEESKEEIEKLGEMQNNFFASMSHEIRTPINTIIGLNEMTMREKRLPEEVQEEFFRNVDKTVSAQINMDLVDKIDAFYTGILNKEL